MAILDEYGRPYRYSHKFAHGANTNAGNGPRFNNVVDDIARLIPKHDRLTLQSLSRRLYTNFGICKSAVDTKADFSVGKAWKPVFEEPDLPEAQVAKRWLERAWFPLCEVRGGTFGWTECLSLISQALDRDGEAFVLLTESKKGDPRIQLLPSHRIGQRNSGDDEVEAGPYKGARIRDGIITNELDRAIGYRVLGEDQTGDADKDISARDLLHVFNPDFQEQLRGLPAFTHALSDFLHCLQSTEYERIAQLMVSSLGLIEYNALGGPDPDDPVMDLTAGSTAASGLTTELYAGGTTRYFKANSGEKLESITHDRPGDLWEKFHDRLIRNALCGVKMPYSLWKAGQQGTAVREEVVRMRQAIEQRQGTLKRVARVMCGYALGKQMDRGRLEPFKGFYHVGFTMPPRPTVDDGREMTGLLKAYEEGALNMTELQAYKGRTVEQHWRERANESAERKLIAAEVSTSRGVEVTESDMGAAVNGGQEGTEGTEETKGKDDDDEK